MKPSRTFRLIGLALFFLLAVALTLPSSSAAAPSQQPSSATTVPIVLRWVPHTGARIRVPALYAPGLRPAGATFSVNYLAAGTPDGQGATCSAWSSQAQTTFTAALNVWATLIESSVPIRIDACWAALGDSSTLGYSWSTLKGNFGAGQSYTWYTSALADALAGHDIDPTKPDTHITYNSQFNWYYGTDGNTPWDKMDLMSVVMHEVGHSLNFSGSMNVDANGLGYWGYTGRLYPNIYDTLVQNGSGQNLLDTTLFPNGSYPLADQLTGDDLWFTGANAKAANGGANVKIYAPFWWQSGSSYSHLDYDTFLGTVNQLMVYALDKGDAIHSPGPVGLGLLKDVGWNPSTPPPGAFAKTAPANGATGQATSLTLSWGSSTEATSYEYCYDTSNNNACDGAWTNADTSTSASLSGLSAGTAYYWQVRGRNSTSTTEADSGTWWTFTTQGGSTAPGAFAKTAPSNGATEQLTSLTLSWGSSSGATSYDYCYDTSNDSSCDTPWTKVDTNTSASLSGLSENTTYYWQVRAHNATGTTDANSGTWWSFTMQSTGPGSFAKTAPANGATGQSTSPTLSWSSSSGATVYDYCYDTSNNSTCDTPWMKVDTNTSAGLSGLSANTTYYWQVRANNTTGTTEANSGTWWSFTTQSGVANDSLSDAISILTTPYSTVENVTQATSAGDDPALPCALTTGYATVWFSFTPTKYGALKVNTAASNYDTIVAVWQGTPGSLKGLGCNDNYSTLKTSLLTVNLLKGNTYYIEVAGKVATTAARSLKLAVTFTPKAPPAPKLMSPSTGSSSNDPARVLDWTDAPGAEYYQVEVRKRSTIGTVVVSQKPTDSTLTTTTLTAGIYYWHVRACNTTGCGPWTGFWYFNVRAPAVPVLQTPANGSTTLSSIVDLDWKDSTGATYYQVQVRKDTTAGLLVVNEKPDTSNFTTPSLLSGHWHYWHVRACSLAGCSAWTAWWRFKVP